MCAGALFKTGSGDEGMLSSVTIGGLYLDAGATARDERSAEPGVFVDLTRQVVVGGLSEVSTAQPTAPNAPYVIT